jgi:hypothetical protein
MQRLRMIWPSLVVYHCLTLTALTTVALPWDVTLAELTSVTLLGVTCNRSLCRVALILDAACNCSFKRRPAARCHL